MPGCSAPNCANSQAKGFALYQFPSDPEAAKVWAGNCRRKQVTTLPSGKTVLSDWKWTKHSKFCQVGSSTYDISTLLHAKTIHKISKRT